MDRLDVTPGHLARRFQQLAVALVQERLEAIGCDLTPVQYAALSAIEARPAIDQVTLAGLISLDRTSTTGVIDRLERKALIVRSVSSQDRRARSLAITDAGRETLRRITPVVLAAQVDLLSAVTPEEARELTRLLAKIVDAMQHRGRPAMPTPG